MAENSRELRTDPIDPAAFVAAFDIAWNADDVSGVVNFFAADASLTFMPPPPPPDLPIYTGPAIRDLVRQLIAEKARVQSSNVVLQGSTLYWSLTMSAGRFRRMGVDPVLWDAEGILSGDKIASLTLKFRPETVGQLEAAIARSVVLRLYEAWNRGSSDEANALLDPHMLDHSPPLFEELTTDQLSFREARDALHAALADARYSIEDLIAEGNKVVVRFTLRGTHQSMLFDMLPTGKQIEIRGIDIWQVSDDVIVERWSQLDTVNLLKQLGFDADVEPPL